jgi:hypothetical protein
MYPLCMCMILCDLLKHGNMIFGLQNVGPHSQVYTPKLPYCKGGPPSCRPDVPLLPFRPPRLIGLQPINEILESLVIRFLSVRGCAHLLMLASLWVVPGLALACFAVSPFCSLTELIELGYIMWFKFLSGFDVGLKNPNIRG